MSVVCGNNLKANCVGNLLLPESVASQAECLKHRIISNGGYVERQAIIVSPLYDYVNTLSYVISDYASIRHLREQGHKVATLTSGTILCCPENQTVILQRRSADTLLYPDRLSMFGGHFCPDAESFGYGEFLDTLLKELMEEANLDLREVLPNFPDDLPKINLIFEPETGSVQFTPVAIALTKEQLDMLEPGVEGGLEVKHLVKDADEIHDSQNWSPMGFNGFTAWKESGFSVQKSWLGEKILA